MNLLESSLIINQVLYKIYYQNNFFVFNKYINNELISIFTKYILLKIY